MILKAFNLEKAGSPKINSKIQYTLGLEIYKMEVQLGNGFLELLHTFISCGNVFAFPCIHFMFQSFT